MHFAAPCRPSAHRKLLSVQEFPQSRLFSCREMKKFPLCNSNNNFIASRHPPNIRLPLLLDQKQEKHFYTSTVASRDLPSQKFPNSPCLLVGCVQEAHSRADGIGEKKVKLCRASSSDNCWWCESVLHQAESQLNAIEKPHSEALPKIFSIFMEFAGANEKKLKIPDMSRQ